MIDHSPASPRELYLQGLELILGEGALDATTQEINDSCLGLDSKSMKSVSAQLLQRYDIPAAAGLSLMAGREEFDTLLRKHGEEIHLLDPSVRMLPLRRRASKSLDALIHWLNDSLGMGGALEEGTQAMTVLLPFDPEGPDRGMGSNIAFFVQGLLQGLMTWISGGKLYPAHIEETTRGMEILISHNPIDG